MVKNFSQNQVERLLDLVPYLSVNPGVRLEKIAEDFRTSKATILEDLNTLWMCGLPGYTPLELIDLSFDTGYVSIRNADILSKPRKLSSSELAAVIVGLSILRESLTASNPHLEGVSELINRLTATTNVPAPVAVTSDVNPETRMILEEAIKAHRNICINYYSFTKDVETSRNIFPISFKVLEGKEYLDAYCHDSEDFRLFRVDRIRQANLTDLERDFSQSQDHEPVLRQFSLRIVTDARKVSEIFHLNIDSNFSLDRVFTATAFNDEWVIRTICSLNASAILCEPSDLRNLIKTRVEKALELYA